MIYLASPYSHSDPVVRAERANAAAVFAGRIMSAGTLIYSPIAHGHALYEAAMRAGTAIASDYETWRAHSLRMLRVCDRLVVLALDGWETSVGVADGMAAARAMNLPINIKSPDIDFALYAGNF